MGHLRRGRLKSLLGVIVAGALVPSLAGATDGYFSHGYGMKSLGMGGASVTRTDDGFGGANNPAEMVFAGNRFDIGLDWFSPTRSASRADAAITPLNGDVNSDSKNFYIPEIAYNQMMQPNLSLGVTVFGNGGMNTDYPQGNFQCPTPSGTFVPANMLCGQGRLGVNLSQLIVAPTLAYKLAPDHAVGVAPLLAYQRFSIVGVQSFAPLSSAPANLTNNGDASSTGAGVRIGYLGRLSPLVSIGATYASKISMRKFDRYKGLFADQGGFDIPSNFAIGASLHPSTAWTIALDYERIYYNSVSSVGNPSTNQAPLGAANGPGFGWQDINVGKLGVEYTVNPSWIVRAGYNWSQNPIQPRDVTFNILAPGVVQDHFTLGFTYAVNAKSELTMAYMYAPSKTVTGSSLFNALFAPPAGPPNAGGTETIKLSEFSLGVAWAMRF
ncbi:Long-chain fatty acid transport protein [Burkholderiales bacterium]|jgi:long-chain fatty acid transport protein|nr:Long-chain fatty acid transport protein [Burkholderiales bacterium]